MSWCAFIGSSSAVDTARQIVGTGAGGTMLTNNEGEVPAAAKTQAPLSPSHSVDQTGNGALAEDVMDISYSDVDEGEITDHSSEPPGTVENQTSSPENEDTYEPPLTVDPVPLRAPPSQQNERIPSASASDFAHAGPSGSLGDIGKTRDFRVSSDSLEDTNEPGETSAASRSQSLADDSDPDEYEPPEPATPVKTPTLPLNHDYVSPEPSSSPKGPSAPSVDQSSSSSVVQGIQDQTDGMIAKPPDIDSPRVRFYHNLYC